MRDHMLLVEKFYAEVGEARVHRNPLKAETRRLLDRAEFGSLRGLVDVNLYVWDGSKAIHAEVANSLGVGGKFIEITGRGDVFYYSDQFQDEEEANEFFDRCPALERALGDFTALPAG